MDHWFATEHVSAHCKSTRRGNSQPPFQFLCSHPSTPRGYADHVCVQTRPVHPAIHPVRVCGYVGLIPLLSTPHQLHHQQFHVQLDIFSCQNILKLALGSSSSIRPLMVMCIILLSLFWSICIPSRDRMGPGLPSPLLKLAIIIIISNISEKTRERTFRQKYTLNGGERQRTGSAPSSSAAEDDCIQFGSGGWMPNCDSHVNRNVQSQPGEKYFRLTLFTETKMRKRRATQMFFQYYLPMTLWASLLQIWSDLYKLGTSLVHIPIVTSTTLFPIFIGKE